ncbi:MAG: hypothetical protein ACFE7R_01515 [Candidatus Hodarchaeota archaeon]
MVDLTYDDISNAWAAEIENTELQNLEDLRFSKMIEYLSGVRLALAETKSDDKLQADLYSQEAWNLEHILKDLLTLRKRKIIDSALSQKRPRGSMILAEEELFNRLTRAIEGHIEFVKESVTGHVSATIRRSSARESTESDDSDAIEYLLVRFLKSIKDPFLGIDEATYGPFKKEDIATIPADNARVWLQDGTVSRVTIDDGGI